MAAAPSSSSEIASEGPVLNLLNKRLRALKKKLNRVNQMEETMSKGKVLNKEQEDTLRTKPSLLAGIDELEKLRHPLSQALDQEIELAFKNAKKNPDTKIQSEAVAAVEPEAKAGDVGDSLPAASDLLNLLYFASVFDVKTMMKVHENMLTRTHERNCCLTYDYVTDDDASGEPLKEWDLDLIAMLGGLLISRPVNSSLSHKHALEECVERAKLWLAKADQPVEPNSTITYAGLREKLNKIMASDYFTTTPTIKAPVEVAAAAGNFTYPVPVNESIISPVSSTVPVEESSLDYQKEEEQSHVFHSNEIYDDVTGPGEELHQEVPEVENFSEGTPQTEQGTGIPDAEFNQNSRDMDSKDQHFSRKPYQTYRGGRGGGGNRRGYGNSRGGRGGNRGGGYQNGHSQYYDQQQTGGGYYPRNNYYRGRGGRGMGGGSGSNYNYHSSAGHAQETL